ncbi:EscT/YscT/HrcT family type III secretion system export apparatus protein, partial [Shigella sonnei]|nr:type III secretion system export apparatus protein SpaR [Escherichia coli]EFW8145607.1 EscT/YscT/HrcT family type III secretion system export apparatus protein [Shigella sonnei]
MDISSWFESIHVFLILLNGVFFRLAPLFFFLPFLNNGIISPSIRIPVIFLVASGLITSGKVDIGSSVFEHVYFLMFKEIIVGLLLSFCLSLPFWIFHAVGSIIDNQRGATLSSSIDPANGVDTSELAKFFNLFSA